MVSSVIGLTTTEGAAQIGQPALRPGAHQQETVAPSFSDLRTMKPATSPGFPVYPDLGQTLLSRTRHPDEILAHALATCSGYAYSDADTLGVMMTRLGLEQSHCRMIARYVDAMLIRSTAFLIQSSDGRVVILCYRGTEPLNLISWMATVDVNPEKVRLSVAGSTGSFEVHAGFYRNVRVIDNEVTAALQRALNGQSVLETAEPMPYSLEALYMTGHSLGGAMAALAAVGLLSDHVFDPIAEKLRAVYTFGQPMIGSPEFARACAEDEFLSRSVIRYRYQNDIVPAFPPTASGAFAHFGQEYRYQNGNWRHSSHPTTQISNLAEIAAAPLALLSSPLRLLRKIPFAYSWQDHLPTHYVSALTPRRVPSEFGD
ncbi:hypothetical protein GCM10009835_16770 [Planosporangium flavigriseum]|uniref:Fungal lipase-type domain-containing protein n=1 Tax=Planosporangium flavigriseum TaxID=373681 RepID=A0A8J3LPG4_9ACTN|nr:hypothetical protein Pfl04_52570 [Planosporangium flavigriseum]